MTPITRLEQYLSILAGGAGTDPDPITREEMYLAKACGVSVTVPDPITREEMYLYKISGGAITLPTPITRLEQFMAAAAGEAVTPPDPVSRVEWFWAQLSNGSQTITGVPPITFTSDGTALTAYSIIGNMQQTGTPTPDAPITPEECGDLVTAGEHAGEYAVPITCAGTTQTIYLSEPIRKIGDYADVVDSSGTVTRRIRKLVLRGNETGWGSYESGDYMLYYYTPPYPMLYRSEAVCTHYKYQNSTASAADNLSITTQSGAGYAMWFKTNQQMTLSAFKQFLADEYAAGTPVTVWYVLATPTTESVTCPTITPSAGSNTMSIGTTLAPSGVSITGHIS